jgi:hypothetical protein
MNPADEEVVKSVLTERPSAGAAAASIDKLDEQLRISVDALLHLNPPPKSELDDLLSAITHHLDGEASERKAIRHRLLSIQNEMQRPASRGFHYLVAICIGVAAILAWQSYGEAAKRIIATRAPELGWSPGTKQMIASWMQQLGWTKPLAAESKAAPVTQTAPGTVAPKAPAAASVDPEQVHQIALDLGALRQTVDQLAASQDQMARVIDRLQGAVAEVLIKMPEPPPPPIAGPTPRPRPKPTATPSSRTPLPLH